MNAESMVLALALLTGPPGSPVPTGPPELLAQVLPALQKLAIERELLDARESRYILARTADFATDVNLLRRRHQELDDAPTLQDSRRFPSREVLNELLVFNRGYRE